MRTVNVLPIPGVLATLTVPPWVAASSATSARPMPEPSWLRNAAPLTRWKRSNSRRCSSGGMPAPVSLTSSCAAPSTSLTHTVTPPWKVAFNAFDSRLSTIFAHISAST